MHHLYDPNERARDPYNATPESVEIDQLSMDGRAAVASNAVKATAVLGNVALDPGREGAPKLPIPGRAVFIELP